MGTRRQACAATLEAGSLLFFGGNGIGTPRDSSETVGGTDYKVGEADRQMEGRSTIDAPNVVDNRNASITVASMSTITIKDLPPAIHRTLKTRAKSHGRSLNKEVLAMLEASLHSTRLDAGSLLSRARAVRETMDIYLTEQDLATLKNEGRQ